MSSENRSHSEETGKYSEPELSWSDTSVFDRNESVGEESGSSDGSAEGEAQSLNIQPLRTVIPPGGPRIAKPHAKTSPKSAKPKRASRPPKQITADDVQRIREEHKLPCSIFVAEALDPGRPPAGFAALTEVMLRCGITLPMHPFLQSLLDRFHLAPMQLPANAYLASIAMYIMYKEYGIGDLSIDEILSVYQMKKRGNLYYFSKAPIKSDYKPIENIPNKVHNWKSAPFLFRYDKGGKFREIACTFSPCR